MATDKDTTKSSKLLAATASMLFGIVAKSSKLLAATASMLFGIVMILPSLWWKGYVIQKLWNWFLLPLNLPVSVPSIYVIIGALMVFHSCLPRPQFYENQVTKGAVFNIAMNLLWPLGFLGFGAFWHWAQWGL